MLVILYKIRFFGKIKHFQYNKNLIFTVEPIPQKIADFLTFTEEIPNGKLHFLGGEISQKRLEMNCLNKVWRRVCRIAVLKNPRPAPKKKCLS